MSKTNSPLLAFNRGEVSKLSLGRVDLERMRLSAEEQINWLPRTLGPMSIRPGLRMITNTLFNDPAQPIPFVFSSDDTAVLELVPAFMRVLIDGVPLSRVAVATTVTNGDFSDPSGWTITPSTGASGAISGGLLDLRANATGSWVSAARIISVSVADQAKEHGFRVEVTRGHIVLKLGTTAGAGDLFEGTLEQGVHSIGVTPGGTSISVQLELREPVPALVDSIQVEAAGNVILNTPWGADDLDYVRWEQSGNVMYVCDGQSCQRKIQRHNPRSWSLEFYQSRTGPFEAKADVDTRITPNVTIGYAELTAAAPMFKAGHVGSLLRIATPYQQGNESLVALDATSTAVKVTGSGKARDLFLALSGTWTATVVFERSYDGPDTGFQVTNTYTANFPGQTYNDALDSQTVWYRFRVSAYTSGSVNAIFHIGHGGGNGIVRITNVWSTTTARAAVLSRLSSVAPSKDWAWGSWSDEKGWPSAVALHDGRLWWAGKGREWASVSDDYENFDVEYIGDAGPLDRTIGFGPVDSINWMMSLGRLIIGTVGSEISVRSSSQDEPITPTNFGQRNASTQGSSPVPPVPMDSRGLFVQASRQRLFQLAYSVDTNDYRSTDLCKLNPDVAGKKGSLVRLAIARQPDTRIYAVRDDGKVAVLLFEPDDEVVCWTTMISDGAGGTIENVYTLPGDEETAVYFIVRRVIGGEVKRFHERQALASDCTGFPDAHLADCHLIYDGSATTTISGLGYLNGQQVTVWGYTDGDSTGKDLGTYTVTGGSISGLPESVTNACVGLPYTAHFKSAKLAYGAQLGTALTQTKALNALSVVLHETHCQGLRFGQTYENLDPLPKVVDGAEVDPDMMWDQLDRPAVPVPGVWSTDSRLCLEAASPRPCTVLVAVVSVNTHET